MSAIEIQDDDLLPVELQSVADRDRQALQLNAMQRDVRAVDLALQIGGQKVVNVEDSLITGEIRRDMTVSEVTITIHDLGRDILKSGILEDEDGDLRAVDIELDGLWFRTTVAEKQADDIVLTFEQREVARLRAKKGPRKAASRAKVTRAQYVLALVRAVRAWHGDWHIPELRKKQPVKKATKKEERQAEDRRRSKGFDKGTHLEGKDGKTLTVTELNNASKFLAQGDLLDAPDLAHLAGLEACIVEAPNFDNPSGGDGTSVGILQVTDGKPPPFDTIQGRRDVEKVAHRFYKGPGWTGSPGAIELAKSHPNWTPGRIAQTIQGSRYPDRYDQYRGQAKAILREWKGTALQAPRYKPYQFRVEKEENYWDAIQRLAKEVGWRAFFSGDTFYYMSEKDLYAQRARFRISETTDGIYNIDFKQNYRRKVATATVSCRIDRWEAPPGTAVNVEGLGLGANGKYIVDTITRNMFSPDATITLKKPMKERKEPRPEILPQGGGAVVRSDSKDSSPLTTSGGAKGIVDQCVTLAIATGGGAIYVVSDYRPGSTTTSGSVSDHASNDATRAARDISHRGINALTGPPTPDLDKAAVAIGKAFGRDYRKGATIDADTFQWKGYRIQIIWRTPKYGGHMGHIHVGARWNSPGSPLNRKLIEDRP